MSETCAKHSFEPAAGVCRQCRNSYCSDCLIYAFGPKKPPYCVTCALNVAGVRHRGAAPNPRLRRKGLFGRKVIVEDEPVKVASFDDFQIELPESASTAPVMMRTTRREASSELIEAVMSEERRFESERDIESAATATTTLSDDSVDSLTGWAESLGSDTDESDETDEPLQDAQATSGSSF